MTSAQEKLYWRIWGEVTRANGWRMTAGRLAVEPEANSARSTVHAEVWSIARGLAQHAHCAVDANVLRRACHAIASGRNVGHSDLDQRSIDKIFNLFRLLVDDTNVQARVELDQEEIGERRRLVWRIKRSAPHAYLDAICRSRFAPTYVAPYWEDLPIACLRDLARTMSERTRHFSQPIPSAKPAAKPVRDLETNPF